ncbi:transcription antitermination protein NusB [Spiroplasma sp. TIUS-1]|uniref:transcription antitermination factor NusB n=1 Tax=Spiroplasma sp. TIUS-1 TaxID=216963 RepID=UPI001398EC77|nr:transcription antitermination factor NusB [Spiroplasma sp. TIUS-1]QHX35921.1 transcription antitermination protein NusB [Spiroplasma sp. TIUS-1]
MKNRRETRDKFIQIIYRFFLLSKTQIESIQEVLDGFQVSLDENESKILISLIENIYSYIEKIKPKLDLKWSWERISPIHKSILICGVHEIIEIKNIKAVVIDASLDLSRVYAPSIDPKFLNPILDSF